MPKCIMSEWKGKTRGGIQGYKIFVFLIKNFGLNTAYLILVFVSAYFVLFAPKATKSIYNYLRKIHKFNRFKAGIGVFKTFYVFGQTLIDKVAIGSGQKSKFKYKFNGRENLASLTSQGGIILSAHLGNWEVAGFLLGDINSNTNILMYQAEHEKIKSFLEAVMTEYEMKVIAIKDDLSHIFKLSNVLRDREVVCIHGDRFLDGSRVVKRNFLGHNASFPLGPFRIACSLKAPTTMAYAFREKNKTYQLSASPILDPTKDPEELLDKYVELLELKMKKYPYQWFNFYDFWNFSSKPQA